MMFSSHKTHGGTHHGCGLDPRQWVALGLKHFRFTSVSYMCTYTYIYYIKIIYNSNINNSKNKKIVIIVITMCV